MPLECLLRKNPVQSDMTAVALDMCLRAQARESSRALAAQDQSLVLLPALNTICRSSDPLNTMSTSPDSLSSCRCKPRTPC